GILGDAAAGGGLADVRGGGKDAAVVVGKPEVAIRADADLLGHVARAEAVLGEGAGGGHLADLAAGAFREPEQTIGAGDQALRLAAGRRDRVLRDAVRHDCTPERKGNGSAPWGARI